MTLLFIRGFFFIITLVVGAYIGSINHQTVLGASVGGLCGIALIFVESSLRHVSVRGLSSMVFGLLLGLVMAHLISNILSILPLGEYVQSLTRVILTLTFSYMGAMMAMRGKDEFNLIIPYVRFKRQDVKEDLLLLDTSVIIDGRVMDIYKTNFLDGRLVVPRFVLQELQKISDSADSVKREKGRRGMEILRLMQKDEAIDIRIHDDDMPAELPVDTKLVRLARILEAKICTMDYNLNRIASIESIGVLNINDLVNSVKSVVFQGEELDIRLTKEGKESHQAVGYLDDGTMVVVSDARKWIGQKVKVIVTSVLQTQAGRMIFAKANKE
ncbi:MAG: hypothetical protein A2787_08690 [Omnitrophica WOR_2 bacterium RIFCSPHIGHO2_01_FULL_48_9]|nr:MAG: hypothetical protein A3D10_02580 [Omnitrophica WOR_2 bacterium RIFCSPHIGHO2_02_FULL_48_11]OGX34271.1 MAG: hypothetical protein A2787_08690 [Omnitrophica WOR_2 bacterium RIFCSPHIGHO2_01_FULL_48_9]